MNTLELSKDGYRHVIRYEVGDESAVLEALVEMVNSQRLGLTACDAAVLSHQLGQHLAKELRAYVPKT